MLRQLHEVSGLPFSKRATGVFKLAQQFKGQKVISMAFPHLIEDFQFFGLARYVNNGEEVLFVDDPPDLLLE
jgi:hypothetical protein